MKNPAFLVLILILGFTILGALLVRENKPTPIPLIVTPLPTPTTTTTTATDDWQTFTSAEYGFSIKHPMDITPQNTEEGVWFNKQSLKASA